MLYFYCVMEGERVKYEGPSERNARVKFEEVMGWVTRNGRADQVTFICRPFEERKHGGDPQVVIPGTGARTL